MNRLKKTLLSILAAVMFVPALFAAEGTSAGTRAPLPSVALAGIINSTGLEILDSTASLMNHSLERNIELTKLYSCSEVDAAGIPELGEIAENYSGYHDFILAGNIVRENRNITINIVLFSIKEMREVLAVSETAQSPVKLRESAGSIIADVVGYLAQKQVSFASLSFLNKGKEEGNYSLYVDSLHYGENTEYIPYLLSGKRRIEIIQERMEGIFKIADMDIVLEPGDRISIEYEIPSFLEREGKLIRRYERTVDLYSDDKYKSQRVENSFRKLLKLLENPGYSKKAFEKKEEIEAKYRKWQDNMKEWGLERGLTTADQPYSFGFKALVVTSSFDAGDWDFTADKPGTGGGAAWGGGIFGAADIFDYAGIQGEFLVYNSRFSASYQGGYPSVNPSAAEFSVWFTEFPLILYFRVPSYLLRFYGGVSYKYRITEMFVDITDSVTLEKEEKRYDEQLLKMQNGAWLAGMNLDFPLNESIFFIDFRFSRDFYSWFESDAPEKNFTGSYFTCSLGYSIKADNSKVLR